MDKLVIEGSRYAGEYDCGDITDFVGSLNMGELHLIKKLTGLRAGELGEAFDAGDSDLSVAIAAVTIERTGKRVAPDEIWKITKITVVFDDEEESEEDDASPPDETPPTKPRKPSGGSSSRRRSVASQESDPSPTGPPA